MAGHKTTRKGGSQAMPNNSNNKSKKASNAPSSTSSSKKKTRKSMESKLHSVYKDEEIEEKGNFDQFENYEYEPPSDFEGLFYFFHYFFPSFVFFFFKKRKYNNR